ncbi:hypothetical protein TRVL_10037 [Trypanosoma vivax]|nr:hypothetical protein TRVL_10037 [Trypanosoma vivax]
MNAQKYTQVQLQLNSPVTHSVRTQSQKSIFAASKHYTQPASKAAIQSNAHTATSRTASSYFTNRKCFHNASAVTQSEHWSLGNKHKPAPAVSEGYRTRKYHYHVRQSNVLGKCMKHRQQTTLKRKGQRNCTSVFSASQAFLARENMRHMAQ